MHHEIALISTIAIGLLYALIGDYLARFLHQMVVCAEAGHVRG